MLQRPTQQLVQGRVSHLEQVGRDGERVPGTHPVSHAAKLDQLILREAVETLAQASLGHLSVAAGGGIIRACFDLATHIRASFSAWDAGC